MKTLFIDKEIKYIGSQLSPHWIYKNFHIMGNAIVSFIGECDVNLSHMVDIEDVINDEPIYSKCMLSFIEENFKLFDRLYENCNTVHRKEIIEMLLETVSVEQIVKEFFADIEKDENYCRLLLNIINVQMEA
jgi:hypothetical protein